MKGVAGSLRLGVALAIAPLLLLAAGTVHASEEARGASKQARATSHEAKAASDGAHAASVMADVASQEPSAAWDEANVPSPLLIAQADGPGEPARDGGGKLEPRYQPRNPEPDEKGWYNGSYIFGMTRSVANSTMVPGAKVPLFVLTIPLDIAFLPFAVIGGFFG